MQNNEDKSRRGRLVYIATYGWPMDTLRTDYGEGNRCGAKFGLGLTGNARIEQEIRC